LVVLFAVVFVVSLPPSGLEEPLDSLSVFLGALISGIDGSLMLNLGSSSEAAEEEDGLDFDSVVVVFLVVPGPLVSGLVPAAWVVVVVVAVELPIPPPVPDGAAEEPVVELVPVVAVSLVQPARTAASPNVAIIQRIRFMMHSLYEGPF